MTNIDVQCEQGTEKESVKSTNVHNLTSTKAPSETTSTLVVPVCVTVAVVVVIILVVVIAKKRKDTNMSPPHQNQRVLNDMYGTCYQGRDYNVAVDNNLRYNEDTDDAVFTPSNKEHQEINHSSSNSGFH